MVDDGLAERDGTGGRHGGVDVGVSGHGRVARVLGFGQGDPERPGVFGYAVDEVVRARDAETRPAVDGVDLEKP